ncbi:hypothetical protein ACJRO7_036148 [Eucalyptus globulus]|uniref:Peroxidase n=1 Tax=Eucalyptus globulus TaxID=34317 RepID=A0ABD3JKA5_EUCGL
MEGRFFPNKAALFMMLLMVCIAPTLVKGQGTRVGFYSSSCPRAEAIIRSTVQAHFKSDPTVAPGLLRMHFHDCFVQGCDGSILIDGSNAEKTAGPNRLLRGYEVIDDAKTQLEAACAGVVSCADILALAARDSVALVFYNLVLPFIRDLRYDDVIHEIQCNGRVSLASNAANLPGFRDSVDVQKQKFADLGLNTLDLVALVGGHTIGTGACQFFNYRLYNFTNTTSSGADASIDPSFVSQLQSLCPQNGDGTRRVALDTGSPSRFDASFFANLRSGRGVLESDQKLWTDASTKTFVQGFLSGRGSTQLDFNTEFAKSMVKMSKIGVKTGTDGEIRKICSAINA